MKALDTNVLVRFLVKDNDRQALAAYRVFKEAEAGKQHLWVPLLVILETIWVLEAVYGVKRRDILDSISELLLMPILKFEAQPALRRFVMSSRDNRIDLPDMQIAHSAVHSGADAVLTFDKKAAKSPLFELIDK